MVLSCVGQAEGRGRSDTAKEKAPPKKFSTLLYVKEEVRGDILRGQMFKTSMYIASFSDLTILAYIPQFAI